MKATLRENYRYVAIEIISEVPLVKDDLISILKKDLLSLIGKIHYSDVMPNLAYFDHLNQKAVIRCLNKGTEDLKTALALFNSYEGKKIHLKAIYTSGTIKKAKEVIR
ncbi:MAG: Rpp14/Pop5 family protein [Candidatus Micrarchaeia archaeon]